MKICPQCEAGYPDELTTCPVHGGLLSEIRDLKPGMLVRNTYRILRKLSQGGMGQVYLAEHILLNETQVLKFLSRELSHNQDWTKRFLREVRTLRQIRHKNVVNAGNLEPAEDGTLFFSMEYVDGPDLMEFQRHAPKPFDVALALTILRGVAEGLGAAHAAGVVHRDIKSENILIAREGDTLVPKIADFGIVATKDVSRITQSGTALLTPQFAAPEQWTGTPTAELDGRTDFYALGGVLFELLTGRCAFDASNYQAWALQHLYTLPPLPSSLRPELANWRGLDELVLRLLAKDRNQRPQDVGAVLRLLNRIEYAPPERGAVEPALNRVQPGPATQAAQPETRAEKPPPEAAAPILESMKPQAPALTAIAAQSAEATQAAEPAHPRQPIKAEPMPIWKPVQPGPRTRRTFLSGIDDVERDIEPARRDYGLILLAAAVVLLGITFAVTSLTVNPVNSRTLSSQRDAILAVAYSPNGLQLASASRDGIVQFWNISDGRPLGTLAAATNCLAYSPAGGTIATGMADSTINLWDVSRDMALATLQGHTAPVAALAFSPDGRMLASGSWDETIRLWDVAAGQLLRTLNGSAGRVLSVAFSPDGRLLASAGTDQAIRFWNPQSGAPIRVLLGHTGAVNSIAFAPQGQTLASASDDGTIRLWEVASGQLQRTIHAQSGRIFSIAFSPDGRTLAAGGADNSVKLWDVQSGRLLRALKGHAGPVFTVAFGPFGSTVASGSADRTVRIWNVANLAQ